MCLPLAKNIGIAFFLAGFLLPGILLAQDNKVLSQQVEMVFKDVRATDRKELVQNCVDTWSSSFFSEQEKGELKGIFEELQKLRLAVNPDLVDFAECVNAFRQRDEKENLNVWLGGLKEAMKAQERKRTVVKNYLAATRPVVCEQMVFSASTHKWLVRGKEKWMASPDLRVDFSGAVVICKTPKDSVLIAGTSASYVLNSSALTGKGGVVGWGAGNEDMYADLSAYRIDLNTSEYRADTVVFHYKKKYPEPILGSLKNTAYKYARTKEAPFPEFTSYTLEIKIDSLFDDLSFEGGISYAGLKLSGFGTDEKLACVHISPNDTVNMYFYSKRFQIDSNRIIGGRSELVLPLDTSRLHHPEINFSYLADKRLVSIKRITEQSLHLPFKDDYHQILFDVELINWLIDSSYMEMSMNNRSGLIPAKIESLNFFSDAVFDDIQGMDEMNPLNGLHKLSSKLKRRTLTLGEYADFMKKPIDQLRKQVVLLSYSDFLTFDETKDEVVLKQRLFDYTRSRAGLQDYDDILFASHPKDTRINAMLDLRNYDLKIYGVEKFTISNVKDIYVEPVDKIVTMKKDRDMEFNGKLKAGLFDMFGHNLYFSYAKYTIDLHQVDSAGMYLTDKTNTNKRVDKVKSLIRDITGNIIIDKPNNKSGKKQTSGFPTFNSTKESYVYFEDQAIRNGVYKRDSFYFVIEPYTLQDINQSDKFRYAFNGTLVSNIVPDIEDTLVLMPDRTLGMKYRTPKNGLQLYDRGNIKSNMSLDQKGFMADGEVNLNKSTFISSDIAMMPKLMEAETKEINVRAVEGQRPEAKGEHVKLKYLRVENNLQATSITKPFDVYKDRVKHNGTLYIYENLMDASGKLSLKDAELNSKLFNLQANNILSNNTALKLSSFANKNIQLNTSNVQANIDLVNNKGKFMNNAEANNAEFPSNHYTCSFKSFTWYMNEAYLNIGVEDEKELARIWGIEEVERIPDQGKNVFTSTDRNTDSLVFIAPLAKYNLITGDISCQWVNHIELANGRFYPDNGNIFINSVGDIRQFEKGKLLCERTDQRKTLTNVNLKLKGRYSFNGGGDFQFVSEEKKKSNIHFSEIQTDTSRFIYAKAVIADGDSLLLNDGLKYKGNIFMYSKKDLLCFRGFVGLNTDVQYLSHTWLKVNSYFESDRIKVPVAVENRDDKNQQIFNGIFLNVDKTVDPYAAFHSRRRFYNDDCVLGGEGEMVYSGKQKQYVITDTMRDKYYNLCYIPAQNSVAGFGKLDFNLDIPGISQNAVGNARYDLKEEQLNLDNVLCSFDFTLLKKMVAVMHKDFADKKKKTIAVDSSMIAKMHSVYGKAPMPLVEKTLAKKSGNIPDSLQQLLVLDSLNFEWNPKFRSYVAKGNAKVVSIDNKPVDEMYNVYVQLSRKRAGNEFYIYIYNDQMWYYYEYLNKVLYTLSSNEEYNTILQNEKADKKMVNSKEKTVLYTITLCPDSKKERFKKNMELSNVK